MSQTRRYTQITKAVYERPWAIQPAFLAVIEEIVRLRATGASLSDEEIDQRVAMAAAQNGPRRGGGTAQGVAVIPIYGVISQRMTLMTAMSGGTSVEGIRSAFREAMADPDIGAIAFDVDSPGGTVEGLTELAGEIRAARGRKPIVAVANATMASAAYWIGSAADEVVATPSGQLGSIGVIGHHLDTSKADEMAGETYTVISAGEGKETNSSHLPLGAEGRAELQALADDFYALFVGDVAKARGVKGAQVRGDWKAQVFTAKRAVEAGLADRIDTLDGTVRRLVVQANTRPSSARAAEVDGAAYYAASAGLTASETVAAALAAAPIHEQLAIVNAEGERIAAHYAKRAELRAKEGRSLPAETEEQLAALEAIRTSRLAADDTDLDTDQPEEADPTPQASAPARGRLDVLEAAYRGGYSLPPIEVTTR